MALAQSLAPKDALPLRVIAHLAFLIAKMTCSLTAFSALHNLKADEIYHFYTGDPLELLQLFPLWVSRLFSSGVNYSQSGELIAYDRLTSTMQVGGLQILECRLIRSVLRDAGVFCTQMVAIAR